MFRSKTGASAIEFALIAPFLFVLTLGVIEFGILLFNKAVVTNASREGARAAIVYDTDGSDYTPLSLAEIEETVRRYTNGYLINLGLSGDQNLGAGDIDVVYESGVPVSGEDVTVTITFTYDFLVFPNLTRLLGGNSTGTIDLVGTTVMRME